MASSENAFPGNEIAISITSEPDFTLSAFDIQPYANVNAVHKDVNGSISRPNVIRSRTFKVLKSSIKTSDFSPELTIRMNRAGAETDYDMDRVENVDSFEILLREKHAKRDSKLLKVGFNTAWQLYQVADYLNINPKKLKSWFSQWYLTKKPQMVDGPLQPSGYPKHDDRLKFAQQLFYPGSWYDEPSAFGWATKFLIYNAIGKVTEIKPPGVNMPKYRLNDDVVRILNGAKGRARNVLQHKLYDLCSDLLSRKPKSCCIRAFYFFHVELESVKVWPMEMRFNSTSINGLIEQLGNFHFVPDFDTCSICKKDYDSEVDDICTNVANLFQGLCLDCMNDSVGYPKRPDKDYWDRRNRYRYGGTTCRIEHGEATWYWSFMGRVDRRKEMMRRIREHDPDSDLDSNF